MSSLSNLDSLEASLHDSRTLTIIIKAIRELASRVEILERKLNKKRCKKKLKSLEERVETLERFISTRNEEKNIERCLKSIVSQTYKNIEIILVDNYSADKTIKIAKKYTNKI